VVAALQIGHSVRTRVGLGDQPAASAEDEHGVAVEGWFAADTGLPSLQNRQHQAVPCSFVCLFGPALEGGVQRVEATFGVAYRLPASAYGQDPLRLLSVWTVMGNFVIWHADMSRSGAAWWLLGWVAR